MRRTVQLRCMLLLLPAVWLAGCEAAGFVAYAIKGGDKIDAVYKLTDRPTVILVDDPQNLLPSAELSSYIAGRVGDALTENEAVGQVIPTSMVTRLKAETPDFGHWPVDKVGQQVGAQQVVYLVVQSFALAEEGGMMRPSASMNVKVVDVAGGNRLFPTNVEQGHPVFTQKDYGSMQQDSATQAVIARQLADALAVDAAQLFYKHPPPQIGSRLPG